MSEVSTVSSLIQIAMTLKRIEFACSLGWLVSFVLTTSLSATAAVDVFFSISVSSIHFLPSTNIYLLTGHRANLPPLLNLPPPPTAHLLLLLLPSITDCHHFVRSFGIIVMTRMRIVCDRVNAAALQKEVTITHWETERGAITCCCITQWQWQWQCTLPLVAAIT